MSKDKHTERPSWDYTETRYYCQRSAVAIKKFCKKWRSKYRRRVAKQEIFDILD